MPYSIVINSYPTSDVPVAHVQGPVLQAMFLNLIRDIDPAVSARLHDDPGYRPFTLSPLGMYGERSQFQGFWLPRNQMLERGTPCYLRLTLLDEALFPVFMQFFREHSDPSCILGETEFIMTDVFSTAEPDSRWSCYRSYPELIDRALHPQRRIKLHFLTPTSFRQGHVDLPLPLPRLIFQSYKKRFEKFYHVSFIEDFEQQVEYHVGVANLKHLRTATIQTKHVKLVGFTGGVVFHLHPKTPPELMFQLNLLAEFAFFCGTGKKTTIGMGQTVCVSA